MNNTTSTYSLINIDDKLTLVAKNTTAKPFFVDFTTNKIKSRINHSKKFQDPLAKSLGIKKNSKLRILDATAGLGMDAFMMASLGAEVKLIERNEIVFQLLEDGLKRASLNIEFQDITSRITLVKGDALKLIPKIAQDDFFDIIYLDPMFPDTEHNSALPKKELLMLRNIISDQEKSDSDKLLTIALQYTKNKVVVKRHKLSPYLQNKTPHHSITGKTNRFDVYYK